MGLGLCGGRTAATAFRTDTVRIPAESDGSGVGSRVAPFHFLRLSFSSTASPSQRILFLFIAHCGNPHGLIALSVDPSSMMEARRNERCTSSQQKERAGRQALRRISASPSSRWWMRPITDDVLNNRGGIERHPARRS